MLARSRKKKPFGSGIIYNADSPIDEGVKNMKHGSLLRAALLLSLFPLYVFNAQPSDRDLYETFLPHFRATVIEGKVYSIMGAYNRVRGESASASKFLLQDLLRDKWGFQGYIVSDCDSIRDIYASHKIVATAEEASALGIKRSCDLDCGNAYKSILGAIKQGLLAEKELDVSVKRLFTARMKLGMFDPPEMVKWAQIPFSVNDSPQNARLAEAAARKSIVLLKNSGSALPLRKKCRSLLIRANCRSSPMTHAGSSNRAFSIFRWAANSRDFPEMQMHRPRNLSWASSP
jgi:beta-glucosidase-like glycosyl hydrolase